MTRGNPDLYAVLGVGRGASVEQIRRAYTWCLSTERSASRRAAVQRAYAVLGDPRLRAEYDRGQVVGVGIGAYFQRESGSAESGSGRPHVRRLGNTLEQRWSQRTSRRDACQPTRPLRAFLIALAVSGVLGLAGSAGVSWWHGGGAAGQPVAFQPTPPRQAAAPRAVRGKTRVAAGFKSGFCYSSGADRAMRPAEPLACGQPHLHEVTKVIDLIRLAGHAVSKPQAQELGPEACLREFRTFTGLSGPTEDLWPTTLTTTGGDPYEASATCVVASRYLRSGSARAIGQ